MKPPLGLLACVLVVGLSVLVAADAPSNPASKEPQLIDLAQGRLRLTAPGNWQPVPPRVQIIEKEYLLPGKEEKDIPGRLTIMTAGGSIQDNIDRWLGQFVQPDGSQTKKRARIGREEIAGMTVHFVDVGGTFRDQAGPLAPAVERAGYRMLAAIIETGAQRAGNYFLKLTGPEETLALHAEAFEKFVRSLRPVR